ncbi:MAG: proline dehydrogenase family protein [Candidatus Nanopelagicales bacterium]
MWSKAVIEKVGFSGVVSGLVTGSSVAESMRRRFVGRDQQEALEMAQSLLDSGVGVTLHVRDTPVGSGNPAEEEVQQYLRLIDAIAGAGLPDTEVSVKLEQLGLYSHGPETATAHLIHLAQAAAARAIPMTLDMEAVDEVAVTLDAWHAAHAHVEDLGIAIQSYLPRSQQDCRDLAAMGARVRLCKGGYAQVAGVTYSAGHDIDLAYVRCARELLAGAYPMFATHDDRLIRIVEYLGADRGPGQWEYQVLRGVRPYLMADLVARGHHVRAYVAFGKDWYSWFVGRLAAKPSNVFLLGRAVLAQGRSEPPT